MSWYRVKVETPDIEAVQTTKDFWQHPQFWPKILQDRFKDSGDRKGGDVWNEGDKFWCMTASGPVEVKDGAYLVFLKDETYPVPASLFEEKYEELP